MVGLQKQGDYRLVQILSDYLWTAGGCYEMNIKDQGQRHILLSRDDLKLLFAIRRAFYFVGIVRALNEVRLYGSLTGLLLRNPHGKWT